MGRTRRVHRFIMSDPMSQAFDGFWNQPQPSYAPMPKRKFVRTQVSRFNSAVPARYYPPQRYRTTGYYSRPNYPASQVARNVVANTNARIALLKARQKERELQRLEWLEKKESLKRAGRFVKKSGVVIGKGSVVVGKGIKEGSIAVGHGARVAGARIKEIAEKGLSRSKYEFSRKKVNLPMYEEVKQ